LTCCVSKMSSACCQSKYLQIHSECLRFYCDYKSSCCDLDPTYLCCVGPPPDPCLNASCSLTQGETCCSSDKSSSCCQTHLPTMTSSCSNADCPYQSFCCGLDPLNPCCTRLEPQDCNSSTCNLGDGVRCCGIDLNNECCKATYNDITLACVTEDKCSFSSLCCQLYPTTLCCRGPVPEYCSNDSCSLDEANTCCNRAMFLSCCSTNYVGLMQACRDDAHCPYKDLCCQEVPELACCVGA
jgi:hypothetical protein